MGTRGILGFVANGEIKISYNHGDSYPSGLGADILGWLHSTLQEEGGEGKARASVIALRLVDEHATPTDEERAKYAHLWDRGVGSPPHNDWYAVLRYAQGDPKAYLAAGVMPNAADFPKDSCMCEYGYVIDFDNRMLEAYRGFNTVPPTAGRWQVGAVEMRGYYPINLVAMWSFDNLPHLEAFENAIDPPESE